MKSSKQWNQLKFEQQPQVQQILKVNAMIFRVYIDVILNFSYIWMIYYRKIQFTWSTSQEKVIKYELLAKMKA